MGRSDGFGDDTKDSPSTSHLTSGGQSKFPRMTEKDLGMAILPFGDTDGVGMPWDIVNRLLWVMDDVIQVQKQEDESSARDYLAQLLQTNKFLRHVLYDPNKATKKLVNMDQPTILLSGWLQAWKKKWDQDEQAVREFLQDCAYKEKKDKDKLPKYDFMTQPY